MFCLTNVFEKVLTKTHHPIRLTSSTPSLDAEGNLFPLMIWKRVRSSFNVIVYNRCPCSPWIRLANNVRLFEMAGQSRHLPLRKPTTWDKTIATGRVLVGMICTLDSDGNLHTPTAQSECNHCKCDILPFEQLTLPGKRMTGTGQTWWSTTHLCQRVAISP